MAKRQFLTWAFREEVYDGEADFSKLLLHIAVALVLLKEV